MIRTNFLTIMFCFLLMGCLDDRATENSASAPADSRTDSSSQNKPHPDFNDEGVPGYPISIVELGLYSYDSQSDLLHIEGNAGTVTLNEKHPPIIDMWIFDVGFDLSLIKNRSPAHFGGVWLGTVPVNSDGSYFGDVSCQRHRLCSKQSFKIFLTLAVYED